MDNINLINVIKSFFLGIVIGVVLLAFNSETVLIEYRLISVLASGSVGFIIGFITEWLTSLLPISIANVRTYFFINNLIAVVVAAFIMTLFMILPGNSGGYMREFAPLLGIVLGIICIANLFDYLMFRRTQKSLKNFKSQMEEYEGNVQ